MNRELPALPIDVLHLIPELDAMLHDLLTSLSPQEWQLATVAKLWHVKDVAAHLLDGNLRGLSTSRDQYFGGQPFHGNTYTQLVSYLNQLNLEWTNAARRLSPEILIYLLQITGHLYASHLKSLPLFERSIFPVAWAGEDESLNWLHIAREYTEKFLHQQQIRSAVGNNALLSRKFFRPFLDILMYALPFRYSKVDADEGTIVTIAVSSDIGGSWSIVKTHEGWRATESTTPQPDAVFTIDPDSAWKLFSGSYKPLDVISKVTIDGRKELAEVALTMVSFMA